MPFILYTLLSYIIVTYVTISFLYYVFIYFLFTANFVYSRYFNTIFIQYWPTLHEIVISSPLPAPTLLYPLTVLEN